MIRRSIGALSGQYVTWSLSTLILVIQLSIRPAIASDSFELMNDFQQLCMDGSMDFKAIGDKAKSMHLPIVDRKMAPVGSAGPQATIWLIRKEPSAALIVAGKPAGGQVTLCGVSDHTTPLADMANELADRIRSKQIKTRGMGVNDVPLEDNGGTVHVVSDPGGSGSSGFFLFRLAPNL